MRRRAGFTLIEIMVAMVILVIISTTFARFAGSFSSTMRSSTVRMFAGAVAAGRMEVVRADPRYTSLVSLYGSGAGADTSGFTPYTNMRRLTTIARDQSGGRDMTTITVRVTEPTMSDTVSVTAVTASP